MSHLRKPRKDGDNLRVLRLPVKAVYFHQIADGEKLEEYRLQTGYWRKRLEGRAYDRVEMLLGYPPASDTARRMLFKWRGYRSMPLTHPHFGPDEVEVYAIDLSERIF